jgi:TPP-dependent indolepyruvate ferredoxin oxidoreductase alpha subunit
MVGTLTGEDLLTREIRTCADTVYAVPGYPVSGLARRTGADLVINEKVALEYAIGDSLAGKRACVIVKHVGMNALADPLVHATFQGLICGVVIICGDDETAKNTMTAQDSRYYGPVCRIPVFEGINQAVVRDAFEASERFSRVALLRVTSFKFFEIFEPESDQGRNIDSMRRCAGSLADPDLTMYGRAVRAAEGSVLINAAGLAPFPHSLLPSVPDPARRSERGYALSLCNGCPFREMFHIMREKGLSAICDAGCSLIAMNPPFSFGLASYGMGSAVAVATRSTKVALIGDYALLHSGLQGLIAAYQHNHPILCIVMVNLCMGMTGGQPSPDPFPWLSFASPIRCDAGDRESLHRLLTIPDRPVTILVNGRCPEVINHETVAC